MSGVQKFSTFHDATGEHLQQWHRPYALLLAGHSPVLDVGCGPGYFAEMVRELGGEVWGIDIDPEMVEMSNQRGNPAILGDHTAVGQYENKCGAIHVSHVVEHLWGNELQDLLRLSARALQPGGVLIIRTPNWRNPVVRHHLFWMDHTHKRPYPAELLARMVREFGLETMHMGHEPLGMEDTFFIAQKPSPGATPPAAPAWNVPKKSLVNKLRFLKYKLLYAKPN